MVALSTCINTTGFSFIFDIVERRQGELLQEVDVGKERVAFLP